MYIITYLLNTNLITYLHLELAYQFILFPTHSPGINLTWLPSYFFFWLLYPSLLPVAFLGGFYSTLSHDTIFTVCFNIFTLFWLIRTSQFVVHVLFYMCLSSLQFWYEISNFIYIFVLYILQYLPFPQGSNNQLVGKTVGLHKNTNKAKITIHLYVSKAGK